jgi:glycosyltransferase involved in cell wall biosynthesis
MSRLKILCFVPFYSPGFRAGGPTRAICNFVQLLGGDFEIKIICKDRDIKDFKPYQRLKIDSWNKVGKAQVFYASKKTAGFIGICKLLNETEYDILYLNSIFTFNFTIVPLIVRRFNFAKFRPCLISSRGELSENALKIKKVKKKIFLWTAKFIRLYQDLNWQASSELEARDIKKEFGSIIKKIKILPDLIVPVKFKYKKKISKKQKISILFLSRISPMKNLDFLLRVFSKIITPVNFSIFGPKEDLNYWHKCQNLIKNLPLHINITVGDEVHPKKIPKILKNNDLFVLPSKGENFGHIIAEALNVATPVLTSNLTLWKSDKLKGLKALPLNEGKWIKIIEEWANLSLDSLNKRKKAAKIYFDRINLKNNNLKKKIKSTFHAII